MLTKLIEMVPNLCKNVKIGISRMYVVNKIRYILIN